MNNKERILVDIGKFDKIINEIKENNFNEKEKEVIESAMNYRSDCVYYLEKGEDFTSLDCIAYGHGLLDALRIIHDLIE